MAAKKHLMPLDIDAAARGRLLLICKRRGMTYSTVSTRLVTWLSQQDDEVQTRVLQAATEESNAALAKFLLQKLSS